MAGACLEDMQGFYVPCNASSQNAVFAYPASSTRKTLVCCGKQYVLVLAAVQMKKLLAAIWTKFQCIREECYQP